MGRVRRAIAILAVLLAPSVLGAQDIHVQLDSVNMTPALRGAIDAGGGAWCATKFRRDAASWNVWVDSLRPADRYRGVVDCSPREAVVLVRSQMSFSPLEFLILRVRALYVVLISPPYGVGMPLSRFRGDEAGLTP